MRIYLIDHYDSFTNNVRSWLQQAREGVDVEVVPFDDVDLMEQVYRDPGPVVLSPGPCSPDDVAPTLEFAGLCKGRVPILGVCLGHQILGGILGGKIVKVRDPHHGTKFSLNILDDHCLFRGLPRAFQVAQYNSLCVQGLPSEVTVTAANASGEIQAFRFGSAPNLVLGIQFHPDSFMSEYSQEIARNWFDSFSGL